MKGLLDYYSDIETKINISFHTIIQIKKNGNKFIEQ